MFAPNQEEKPDRKEVIAVEDQGFLMEKVEMDDAVPFAAEARCLVLCICACICIVADTSDVSAA